MCGPTSVARERKSLQLETFKVALKTNIKLHLNKKSSRNKEKQPLLDTAGRRKLPLAGNWF